MSVAAPDAEPQAKKTKLKWSGAMDHQHKDASEMKNDKKSDWIVEYFLDIFHPVLISFWTSLKYILFIGVLTV